MLLLKYFIRASCMVILFFPFHSAALDYSQQVKMIGSLVHYPENSIVSPGDTSQTTNFLNYRLTFSEKFNRLSVDSHYQLISLHNNSDTLNYQNPDKNRLFNLSSNLQNKPDQLTYHRLDRLSLTYKTNTSTFRFGRQAVTWGNGLVFNVMDIFNPFAPLSIDTEYKNGDDMIYLQTLNDSGNDWQFIYLPRRDNNGDLQNSLSSGAAKFHGIFSSTDFDFLISRHFDEQMIGLGISHAIKESMWRLDITSTKTASNNSITSLTSNIDYSWQSFGKNIYGFFEYYYNGFGLDKQNIAADSSLLSRLERGEIFTLYQNYLAAGLRIESHALVNISPTLIHNLTDDSQLFNLSVQYDWRQSLSLTANLIYSRGTNTSEYGGTSSPGNAFQVFLNYYF